MVDYVSNWDIETLGSHFADVSCGHLLNPIDFEIKINVVYMLLNYREAAHYHRQDMGSSKLNWVKNVTYGPLDSKK